MVEKPGFSPKSGFLARKTRFFRQKTQFFDQKTGLIAEKPGCWQNTGFKKPRLLMKNPLFRSRNRGICRKTQFF